MRAEFRLPAAGTDGDPIAGAVRRRRAGGLPDRFALVVTPAQVLARSLDGDAPLASWDRGALRVSSARRGGITKAVLEDRSRGERIVLECMTDEHTEAVLRLLENERTETMTTATVTMGEPGRLERALQESGWIEEEVLAAGHFRQGRVPSMAALLTGTALIEALRPRRSARLPRRFVLAATRDAVYAFRASGVGIGEPMDDDYRYDLRIEPEIVARVPRGAVAVEDVARPRGGLAATLVIEGERIPIVRQRSFGDPGADALMGLLSGASSS